MYYQYCRVINSSNLNRSFNKFIFNKYLKKVSTINTVKLLITANSINYKIITINNEALKEVCAINIVKL